MDVNKCLPPELTIESVDDILYRIGLCFTSVRDQPKRRHFYNPYFIFTFLSLFLIRELFIISLKNDELLKAFGSWDYMIGAKLMFGVVFILAAIIILSSQLIYYYNYRNGIKPTFLRVFQMMSGLVSPIILGLTNENEIRRT